MSANSLRAIVYVSASTHPMTTRMLEEILVDALALNRTNNVTGALIYSEGIFMQYFEGAPAAVAETYERIANSRKHSRIVEMMNEVIPARVFPDWQMALAQPTLSELLAISTANWVVNNSRSHGPAQASVGMAMLRDFWNRRRPPLNW